MKHKSHRSTSFHQTIKSICKAVGCSDFASQDGYCKNCYEFYGK